MAWKQTTMKTLIESCLSICKSSRLPIIEDIVFLIKNNQMLEDKGISFTSANCIIITKDNIKYLLNKFSISYSNGSASHSFHMFGRVSHTREGEYHGRIHLKMVHGNIDNMKEEDVFNRGYFWKGNILC